MEACFLKRQFPCCLTVSADPETFVVLEPAFCAQARRSKATGTI